MVNSCIPPRLERRLERRLGSAGADEKAHRKNFILEGFGALLGVVLKSLGPIFEAFRGANMCTFFPPFGQAFWVILRALDLIFDLETLSAEKLA